MKLTPRAEEVAEVVAIMERDYPTGEAMAKDIIKAVAEMLWFRVWYVLIVRWDDPGEHTPDGKDLFGFVSFGPYASDAEARTFAASFGTTFQTMVITVNGLGKPEQRVGGGFGYCCTEGCGHPPWGHLMSGTSRGKCLMCKACDSFTATKPDPNKPKPRARARKATA